MRINADTDTMARTLMFLHPDMGKDEEYGAIELSAAGCSGNQPNLWEGFCGGEGGMVTGWFTDPKKLILAARDLNNGWTDRSGEARYPKSVYITVNPTTPALLGRANNRMKAGKDVGRTKDEHIKTYHNIFIDLDSERVKGVSADRLEHETTFKRAEEIKRFINDELFWPEPLYADSGNGAHLIYKTHFPSTKENVELLKRFQQGLAVKFPTKLDYSEVEIKIDASVYNPGRITKLYGTAARKGDSTADRPHRLSRIIEAPDLSSHSNKIVVSLDMLRGACAILEQGAGSAEPAESAGVSHDPVPVQTSSGSRTPPTTVSPRPDPAEMFRSVDGLEPVRQGGTLKVDEYLRDNGIKLVKLVKQGDATMYELDRCLFDDDHSVGSIGQNPDGSLWYHCFHDSCKTDPERKWKQARQIISGDARLGRWMEGGAFGIEFPHVNRRGAPVARIENFRVLVKGYNAELRYNTMTRKVETKLPKGLWVDDDRQASLGRDFFEEVCTRHGLSFLRLESFMRQISAERAYHPVKNWIESKSWDGKPRLEELANTILTPEDQKRQWRVYLTKWLIQGVAAVYSPKFAARGVLTFTGAQGVGKTQWFKQLLPAHLNAFGEGMHIDPSDKDSKLEVLSKLIVELGELDATFRKADIARLKAFLTKSEDDVRPPYGRTVETWKRRTVFGATVNDPDFLIDATGNTRWWVIETLKILWNHGIDMQQVWAEVKVLYDLGATWFLDEEETRVMNNINMGHAVSDPIEEGLHKYFQFETLKASWRNYMTMSDILLQCGIPKGQINRSSTSKAGVYLRGLVDPPRQLRVNGVRGRYYNMPPKRDVFADVSDSDNVKSSAEIIDFPGGNER